jgi:hypothetical protein
VTSSIENAGTRMCWRSRAKAAEQLGAPYLQQKDGESLYNGLLRLEFALISLRLMYGSKEPGPSKEFTEMGIEYLAWRTRVDDVTLHHINPDSANLFARDQKIQRESYLPLPNA